MTSQHSRLWKLTPALLGLAMSLGVRAQDLAESRSTAKSSSLELAVALDSLDLVGGPAQLETLRSRLDDSSSLLRGQALASIDASTTIDGETKRELLHDALEDRDPLVAEMALQSLIRRGEDELPRIREANLENFSGETQGLASVLLSSSDKDTSTLRELMKTGDAQVQQAAFEELASSDAKEAIDALKEEFSDQTSVHRLQTLDLFIRSPYTSSSSVLLPLLQSACKDEDPLVKGRALQALEEGNY